MPFGRGKNDPLPPLIFLSERSFIQEDTHSIDRVWAISEDEAPGLSVFIALGNYKHSKNAY